MQDDKCGGAGWRGRVCLRKTASVPCQCQWSPAVPGRYLSAVKILESGLFFSYSRAFTFINSIENVTDIRNGSYPALAG